MSKSKDAFLFSAGKLAESSPTLYLWTFTFAEVLDIVDTRKRWNHLLTRMRRHWPDMCGLRVFELHPGGHGLHVHLVTNLRIDVNQCRMLSNAAGWGRIHVEKIPAARADYLAKYLDKKRPPCFNRWRLWDSVGKAWTPTRTKDVEKVSMGTKVYAACRDALGWEGKGRLRDRMEMTRQMVNKTIEGGWEPGFGPGGMTYRSWLPMVIDWAVPREWLLALGGGRSPLPGA